MKPAIQYVKRKDGATIAYSEFGHGQPLIYPAPWVTNLAYFFEDPSILRFWEKISLEMRVILYDKYGCGQSDRNRKNFSIEEELLDLESIIDHLNLEKVVLFGISMAGPIAISYASKYPDKIDKLVLYGTYSNGNKLANTELREAIISMVKAHWGLGSKTLAEFFIPNATPEDVKAFVKFMQDSADSEMATNLIRLSYSIDVTNLLDKINVPTMILHKDRDKVIPVKHGRFLAMNIPNSKFKTITGNIHFPFHESGDEIVFEILKFLGKNLEPKFKGDVDLPAESIEQNTIVFTDIVASTDMLTNLGDATARDIFIKHDQIIRNQLKFFRGKELQNLGDGFMLSFSSASLAIKCSCAILREIKNRLSPVKIRIGINTGEVVFREGEHPFGQAVVIASRINQKCKGGQILVSDITKKMVSGSMIDFEYKGNFSLKGISGRNKLYEPICVE